MSIRSLNEAVRDAMRVEKLDTLDLELTELEDRFEKGMATFTDLIKVARVSLKAARIAQANKGTYTCQD